MCVMATMQCVTITSCGNFAIIGMNTGHVEMFNIQSGIHRGEFGKPRGLWQQEYVAVNVGSRHGVPFPP